MPFRRCNNHSKWILRKCTIPIRVDGQHTPCTKPIKLEKARIDFLEYGSSQVGILSFRTQWKMARLIIGKTQETSVVDGGRETTDFLSWESHPCLHCFSLAVILLSFSSRKEAFHFNTHRVEKKGDNTFSSHLVFPPEESVGHFLSSSMELIAPKIDYWRVTCQRRPYPKKIVWWCCRVASSREYKQLLHSI